MTLTTPKPLKLKSGMQVPANVPVSVYVPAQAPHLALLKTCGGLKFRMKSTLLHKLWPDTFIDPHGPEVREAFENIESISLTGEPVEVDGFDQHGFPSALLALQLV